MKKIDSQTCSAEALAACLGVSKRQIERLARDGIIQRVSRGSYGLAQSVSGFLAYCLAGQSSANEPEGVVEARKEVLIQQARRLRRDNQLREGELLESSFVENILAKSMQAAIGAVMSLPGRCASNLVGKDNAAEIRSILLDEAHHVRATWSQAFSELSELPDSPPPACPVCGQKPWSFHLLEEKK